VFLIDLDADPHETKNVAESHPDIVRAHRKRTAELSQDLSTRDLTAAELTNSDRATLRALGYVE
jgi:hypothetical protein